MIPGQFEVLTDFDDFKTKVGMLDIFLDFEELELDIYPDSPFGAFFCNHKDDLKRFCQQHREYHIDGPFKSYEDIENAKLFP